MSKWADLARQGRAGTGLLIVGFSTVVWLAVVHRFFSSPGELGSRQNEIR
jgi:hypothetical protein